MNNELKRIIKEKKLHPLSYQKKKNVYIINNNYVIKLHTSNYDIYKYLTSRDFLIFPKNYNLENDDYDISSYINGVNVNDDQKINDYIKLIALLHQKTSYKREIDLDEIKEKYERINNQINYLRNYYLKLNEDIEHELFFSPSSYLLVRNISLIYRVLDISEKLLNDTYNEIKNEKSIRISLLHNNPDLSHLIISDKDYLISWDKAYFDNPIWELEKIYRKYYQEMDLIDLLNIYESIYKLTSSERKILLINLSIPRELQLTKDTFSDTQNINSELKYLKKVYNLLMKYQKEL